MIAMNSFTNFGKKVYPLIITLTILIFLNSCNTQPTYTAEQKASIAEYEAFSYAAGFALQEMYAENPTYHGCAEGTARKPSAGWGEIKVENLGNDRYYVIGWTKAINYDCFFEHSYFAVTVQGKGENWSKVDEVYFSNKCVKNKVICPVRYALDEDWKLDMNWRPPK